MNIFFYGFSFFKLQLQKNRKFKIKFIKNVFFLYFLLLIYLCFSYLVVKK
uniref:Uncharacterized protein n=1 Tax=Cyanoptyche gloeocystis TaxID=77922 RepID=A0A3G1IW72_9EUKA|nr:hypothetical protein [Cyanoptyche gloeocystis]